MWQQNKATLVGTYEFSNFFKAVTFIEKISLLCDNLQHLPQWQNSLHRVRVEIKVDKTGRKESASELQQQIEDIFAHI
jgi:pterin-4a-carbinolamine dehydratase